MDKLGVWHHLNGCEKSDFLFPVHGMSRKFRGRFMALLTRRLKEEGLVIADYIRKTCFDKDWVVYSRPPAKGVDQVLEYIARYAYRVAITNSRILDVTDSNVSYDYKDYRKGGKHGVMTMEIDKFLGLLSLHVLCKDTTLRHTLTMQQGCTAQHTEAARCAARAERKDKEVIS